MSTNHDPNRGLGDYLHRRLEDLQQCNAHIETHLHRAKQDLCKKIDDGVYSENGAITEIDYLESVVGKTFRYTMLAGVCSFLEEAMKLMTRKKLVSDYDTRIRSAKPANWLNKHIEALCDFASLDTANFQSGIDKFNDLITLRNCIVHTWGNVAKAQNPAAVKAAAQRIETAGVSDDGFLLLGDQVIPEAIDAAEKVADSILTLLFQTSMT